MAHMNQPPPVGSGPIPAPGLPPARFAGWAPVTQDPSAPFSVAGTVPHPSLYHSQCMPGIPNLCNPGPGKCVVPAVQPVIPVPVYQEIHKKDRIVEVPQTVVVDQLKPNIFTQEIEHEIPDLKMIWDEKRLVIPRVELVEKTIEIPVPVGYNFKIVPKWEVREVPKVIPRYDGEQQVVEVEVPQIKIVDKSVDKEVPVFVGEKTVEKIIYEQEIEETIQYKYVEKEEEVPIFKYKPVFDVEVDVPPPLIVPVPVKPEEKDAEVETISYEEYLRRRSGGAIGECCLGGDAAK